MLLKTVFCVILFANFVYSSPAVLDAVKNADESGAKLWALIVAGSNSYVNYRHQSDVCHAYHILHDHGIPDEQIVVMMYDDIAYNEDNPDKGVIINHLNGPNLYPGVLKDYTAGDVTSQNFLHILQGDEEAMSGVGSGKVIKSGPNDHVFVYFTDHGAPGLIAFPEYPDLGVRALNKAIMNMYEQKKYGKMVFYIEACESGSMFDKTLKKNINVYATTAANGMESSYACYWDDHVKAYLGDLYSVNWMEDTDKENIEKETLQKQFKIVKKETNLSHVQEYGDLSIGQMKVGEFQGLKQKLNQLVDTPTDQRKFEDAVDARDVPVFIEMHKLKDAKNLADKEDVFISLRNILEKRIKLISKVKAIFDTASQDNSRIRWEDRVELNNLDCYEPVVEQFNNKCYNIAKNEYSMTYLHKFVTLCERNVNAQVIVNAIDAHCDGAKILGVV